MTAPNLTQFCYTASHRVMTGLAQELRIEPGRHYRPAGYNASRVLSLRLAGINPAYLPQIKKMQGQLGFWAGLKDEYKIRIGHDGQAVIIEIPKPKTYWKQVTLDDLTRRRYIKRGAVATLGLGLQDEARRINFREEGIAHVMISGQTRSGKTTTQKLIAWNIAHNIEPTRARMILIDVAKKGLNWRAFENEQHLAYPLITDLQTAERMLSSLSLEIDRRAETHQTAPRLFIFIDELKALVDDSPLCTDYLSRIASVGGEFGLHLVLATQYPQIKMLGSAELKRNVTTRLCGRVDDATAAANALGLPDSGAETLGGYGDFLLKDFDGLSRLTVAHIQTGHIEALSRGALAPLDLPHDDAVQAGPPPPTPGPDPLEPEQVALALFEPMGITRLAGALSVGSAKAQRIKDYADTIRQWAIERGHTCLPDPSPNPSPNRGGGPIASPPAGGIEGGRFPTNPGGHL